VEKMAPKSMEICAFLDCKYIVVHGLKVKQYYGTEEAEWEKTAEILDGIAPMAKEAGITICVENLYNSSGRQLVEGPCCNAKRAAERIDRFNEKYGTEVLGFCFDTGHANLVGIDFEPFLTTLGKRLKVLHVHDNDGVADLHQMPFTFTKTRENHPSTDWDGFIRGLRAIGFDGVLNFETAPVLKSFPEELRPQALHMLAQIGHYFAEKLEE
ncbi:MAG: sugar phosphate isomerase/epimerase, partial [Lachnospiraceae bacterium]|nr:sugar phosphate isomerase/epimerase [Lachnospiraceae bacterium]